MSRVRKPIIVVGSINIDLVANAERIPAPGETVIGKDFQTHPGGKGANQAVAVARLDYPVAMIGRVGDDTFGLQLQNHLRDLGVDITGVLPTKGPSGVAVIVVAQSGENSIVVTPGANAHLIPKDLDDHIELIRSAAMVLTQLEIPLETVCHLATLCSQEGIPLMLDPAPARSLPSDLLTKITWFTPNESESAFFVGTSSSPEAQTDLAALSETLLEVGPHGVVLKLGARGAFVANSAGIKASIAPFRVTPLDTTAAGDCFNGAFATALCGGQRCYNQRSVRSSGCCYFRHTDRSSVRDAHCFRSASDPGYLFSAQGCYHDGRQWKLTPRPPTADELARQEQCT